MFSATPLILGQAGGGGPPPLVMVGVFAAMFGVMWFIMIRPQQKQAQQHKAMLSALTKGDEVVTQGGMVGKINTISDRVVTLEVSSGVKIRVLKTFIQGKYTPAAESAAPAPAAKTEESKEEK